MRPAKKMATVLLLALITLGGCSASPNVSSEDIPSAPTMTFSDETSSVPFENKNEFSEPESPYLKYLGSEDPTKTDAYVLYFANYGQRAADKLITREYVSPLNLAGRLTELIASDLSPDLCDKTDSTLRLIYKNSFEDLTNYIDVSAPQWQEYSEYLENTKYKGGQYFYPTSIKKSPYFLIYNKSRLYNYGLENPALLWRDGRWSFDKLTTTLNFARGIGGGAVMENMLNSAGAPVISVSENGQFSSNLGSETFLEALTSYSRSYKSIGSNIDEKAAMIWNEELGCLSITAEELARIRTLYPNDARLEIVPYPLPEDGRYYAETKGYLVPKRAKNITGAASFINCSRIAARLDGLPDGLSDEDIKTLTELNEQSFSQMRERSVYCLDTECNNLIKDLLENASSKTYDELEELAGAIEPPISKAISDINRNLE